MAAGAHQDEVIRRALREFDPAADEVIHDDRLRPDAEPDDEPFARSGPPGGILRRQGAAPLRILVGALLGLRLLAIRIELLRCAEAAVCLARVEQLLRSLLIKI